MGGLTGIVRGAVLPHRRKSTCDQPAEVRHMPPPIGGR
jgi:hypothetical protein